MTTLLLAEDFESLVGHTLPFQRDDDTLPLVVKLVRRLELPSPRSSPSFAVLLCDHAATRSRSQGIWSVELGARGPVAIFLVPVAPDSEGACYEAVFN